MDTHTLITVGITVAVCALIGSALWFGLSVDYPTVVSNYRAASAIAARNSRGEADTEDLRQALVYYRELFRELLAMPEAITEKEPSVSSRVGQIFHKAGV